MSENKNFDGTQNKAFYGYNNKARGLAPRFVERSGGPDGWRLNKITLSIIHGLVGIQGGDIGLRDNLFQEYLECAEATVFFPTGLKHFVQAMLHTNPWDVVSSVTSNFFMMDCTDPSAVVDTDTPLVHPGWTTPIPTELWYDAVVEPCYYQVSCCGGQSADTTGVEQFTPSNAFLSFDIMAGDPADNYDSDPTRMLIYIEPESNSSNLGSFNRYQYAPGVGITVDEPDKLTPPGLVLFAASPSYIGNQPLGTHERPLCVFTLPDGLIQRWSETPGLGQLIGLLGPAIELEIVRV